MALALIPIYSDGWLCDKSQPASVAANGYICFAYQPTSGVGGVWVADFRGIEWELACRDIAFAIATRALMFEADWRGAEFTAESYQAKIKYTWTLDTRAYTFKKLSFRGTEFPCIEDRDTTWALDARATDFTPPERMG